MFSKINKTILVAPLDWGLGHATRCIPIIRYMALKGCRIVLAAEGKQANLFEQEFPVNELIPLKGYRVKYPANKDNFSFKIAAQVPQIMRSIRHEQEWLKRTTKERKIDGIISDNRYGLYHRSIPSVFITHQLSVKSGISKTADNVLQKINYRYINRFTECWVPDIFDEKNLAAELSHPRLLPKNTKYIGWLSRMETISSSKEYDILCILSGPEPQRSILEEKLIAQLSKYNGKAIIVRGLPDQPSNHQITKSPNHQIISHLDAKELNDLICKSKLVICRSGYSSVMDLVKLQQKALLIPTPGQTEQEYLSKHLSSQNFFPSFSQEDFDLEKAERIAGKFNYQFPVYEETYPKAVDAFLERI